MKRAFAIGLGGVALIVACNNDDYFPPPYPTTAFPSASSTSSATSSASSTSGTSGRPRDAYCSERPYCGNDGCCPPSWRCVRDECLAPGLHCNSDADCSADRYCDLDLAEPRCYPRVDYCRQADSGPDCINPTCDMAVDMALSNGKTSCDAVSLYVKNLGAKTLPPGALVSVEVKVPRRDAGADAGDAGDPAVTVVGTTADGILPGEVILLVVPVDVDYRASITATVITDAGAAVGDCQSHNDTDNVYNSCGIPK